jgi:Asp-tRNA(Asn)/Glu-tRNA(Gln) amidotransferase A subunit family amidase
VPDAEERIAGYLARIERLDPALHAYLHVDRAARAGKGPLRGVGIAVKDTLPVAGMPWTRGSRRWRDRVAGEDAPSVARARAAGATILGKVNLPELAAAVGTANELGPPTQNPWRAGYTPGGSSGGSGAAVAAGLCTFSYASDMGGSIRIPAACCGVVGLRPTPGRLLGEAREPTGLAVGGPIARTVADIRLGFSVMAGLEVAPGDRRRARIGLVEAAPLGADRACLDAVRRAADALAAAGHSIEPIAWNPGPVAGSYRVVRPASVAGEPGEPEEYGPGVRALIRQGRVTSAGECLAALGSGLAAAQPLRDRLATDLDAVLTPTLGLLPMPIPEVPTFLADGWDRYTQFVLPVSYAGVPAVSIPAGVAGGLPIGVQLAGRELGEWALLDLAEELETAAGFGFQPPPLLA